MMECVVVFVWCVMFDKVGILIGILMIVVVFGLLFVVLWLNWIVVGIGLLVFVVLLVM